MPGFTDPIRPVAPRLGSRVAHREKYWVISGEGLYKARLHGLIAPGGVELVRSRRASYYAGDDGGFS